MPHFGGDDRLVVDRAESAGNPLRVGLVRCLYKSLGLSGTPPLSEVQAYVVWCRATAVVTNERKSSQTSLGDLNVSGLIGSNICQLSIELTLPFGWLLADISPPKMPIKSQAALAQDS